MLELWALCTLADKAMIIGIGVGLITLEYIQTKQRLNPSKSKEQRNIEAIINLLEAAITEVKENKK